MSIKILLTIALVWPVILVFNHQTSQGDRKAIEGSWVVVEAELGGQKLDSIKGTKLILTGDTYQYQNDRGEYKLHLAEEVNAIDIIGREGPNKGKSILAIYELTGDKLKICYELGGKARPARFNSEAGTRQFLVTYQREKK